MKFCTARNAQGANGPRLFARVNACRLRRNMHVVRISGGVHGGPVFQFQRRELLALGCRVAVLELFSVVFMLCTFVVRRDEKMRAER